MLLHTSYNFHRIAKIHPLFHVSSLKKFFGDLNTSSQPLPILYDDSFPVLAPQHILASREILRNGNKVIQKLVCWEGLPPEEATWEDLNSLSKDLLNPEN